MAFTALELDYLLRYLGLKTYDVEQQVITTWANVSIALGVSIENDIRSLLQEINENEAEIRAAHKRIGEKQMPGQIIDYRERIAGLTDRQRYLASRIGTRIPQLGVIRDYWAQPISGRMVVRG